MEVVRCSGEYLILSGAVRVVLDVLLRVDTWKFCVMAAARRTVALVTGASKGIGFEIALKLGAVEGLTTVLGCQELSHGEAAAAKLRAAGCTDIVVQRIELLDAASITSAREYVERQFGALDILINNARDCTAALHRPSTSINLYALREHR